jgi:MoxR-like ATPase
MENSRPAYYGIHVNDRETNYEEDAFVNGYVAIGWLSDVQVARSIASDWEKLLALVDRHYKRFKWWTDKPIRDKSECIRLWCRFVSLGKGDVVVMRRQDGDRRYAVGRVLGGVRGFEDPTPASKPASKTCPWTWWVPVEWCRPEECIERPPKINQFALSGIQRIGDKVALELEKALRNRGLSRFILSSGSDLGGLAMDTIEALLKQQGQVILCGPPGTSKTFTAQRLARKLILGTEDDPTNEFPTYRLHSTQVRRNSAGVWEIVQFHPSYTYEDFVRGIQARTLSGGDGRFYVSYEVVDRVFAEICRVAADGSADAHRTPRTTPPACCLIIDEINRANLASVLGELIYALEYRDHPVETPYALAQPWKHLSERQIKVPPNLYLIGTMNTADRSIGHLDYAVRRRFAFVHCPPDIEVVRRQTHAARDVAVRLFERVAQVFTRETVSPEFSREDVQIGHTYFLVEQREGQDPRDDLVRKFVYQVYPILREYVKDGILRPQDGLRVLPDIVLDREMMPREVEQAVKTWLDAPESPKSDVDG